MTVVKSQQFAPRGSLFAPDAFSDSVGKSVDMRVGDTMFQDGAILRSATVDPSGRFVTIEVDVPEGVSEEMKNTVFPILRHYGSLGSIGFRHD